MTKKDAVKVLKGEAAESPKGRDSSSNIEDSSSSVADWDKEDIPF